MFNNNQEQLQSQSTSTLKQFTGLHPMQVVAINPSVERLTEIIGEGAAKFNLNYAIGQYGKPVTFWFKSPDNKVQPFQKTIFLKDEVVSSEGTGKTMLLNNSTGQYGTVQSTWSTGPDDLPTWFANDGVRPAKKGEYEYYDFVVKLIRFRDKSDGSGVNYVDFLKEESLDFDSVLNGDDTALNNFADYLIDNGNTVVMLLTVRESDSGKVYQSCELSNCVFGQNKVTDKLKERVERLNSNPDYPVSKDKWTVEFTEYVAGAATDVPVATAVKAEPKKKTSWI